jgi:hypothetical protein
MFLTAYLVLVLLAVLPLARTILTARGGRPPVVLLHRLYRDLAYLLAAVLAIICFETAFNISLQNYWFGELGQRYRYWLALGLRFGNLFHGSGFGRYIPGVQPAGTVPAIAGGPA